MGAQNQGKLNWLQHNLPEGLVVDAAWLERHGYSGTLRQKYVHHGWLELVSRALYRRPPASLQANDKDGALSWQQVVISLQTVLECPLTVGGRTALELQGFAHYLSTDGPREVHLYGGAPPPWVAKLALPTSFVFHNAKRLFRDEHKLTGPGLLRQSWGHWNWPLTISSPERAVLELLDEVPRRETFHQADVLMEGLGNLSPRRVHTLLARCRSVKVKRLFLWFAERHNHAWAKRLDREDIDLGRGKRQLARGGKLDAKFNITVPENLDAGG